MSPWMSCRTTLPFGSFAMKLAPARMTVMMRSESGSQIHVVSAGRPSWASTSARLGLPVEVSVLRRYGRHARRLRRPPDDAAAPVKRVDDAADRRAGRARPLGRPVEPSLAVVVVDEDPIVDHV